MNIIIITGASSGIGQEFARQIDKGFSNIDEIWLIARRKERLEEFALQLLHQTRILTMDVNDEYAMDDFEKMLYECDCRVRMLVNCAGYGMFGQVDEMEMEEQLGMIQTNCEALTRLTYLCLPYMYKNSRIINLASSAAFMPQAGFAVYAASKAYVLSFSRGLNQELRKRHIYVTAVCPGPVRTEFFDIAERYGGSLAIKKLVMAEAENVVDLALRDSYNKKDVSVYSIPIKAFMALTKYVPHSMIMAVTRLMK